MIYIDHPPSLETQLYLDRFPDQTPAEIYGQYEMLLASPGPHTRILHRAFSEAVQLYPLDNREDLGAVSALYDHFIASEDESAMGLVLMSIPTLREVDPSAAAVLARNILYRLGVITEGVDEAGLGAILAMAQEDPGTNVRILNVERWRRTGTE